VWEAQQRRSTRKDRTRKGQRQNRKQKTKNKQRQKKKEGCTCRRNHRQLLGSWASSGVLPVPTTPQPHLFWVSLLCQASLPPASLLVVAAPNQCEASRSTQQREVLKEYKCMCSKLCCVETNYIQASHYHFAEQSAHPHCEQCTVTNTHTVNTKITDSNTAQEQHQYVPRYAEHGNKSDKGLRAQRSCAVTARQRARLSPSP